MGLSEPRGRGETGLPAAMVESGLGLGALFFSRARFSRPFICSLHSSPALWLPGRDVCLEGFCGAASGVVVVLVVVLVVVVCLSLLTGSCWAGRMLEAMLFSGRSAPRAPGGIASAISCCRCRCRQESNPPWGGWDGVEDAAPVRLGKAGEVEGRRVCSAGSESGIGRVLGGQRASWPSEHEAVQLLSASMLSSSLFFCLSFCLSFLFVDGRR